MPCTVVRRYIAASIAVRYGLTMWLSVMSVVIARCLPGHPRGLDPVWPLFERRGCASMLDAPVFLLALRLALAVPGVLVERLVIARCQVHRRHLRVVHHRRTQINAKE